MEATHVSFPREIMRPVYVSMIKLFGIPIIGPCMNETKRAEMRSLREKAIEVERRLSKKRNITTESLNACKTEDALPPTPSASNETNLASNETSLASKEATTASLHSFDSISNQALAIEIHSPSGSVYAASASISNPGTSRSAEPCDFAKTYLSFPPLDADTTIESHLCFRPDSSGSVDLNLDLTASSVCSPHRPHDLSLLEGIRAPDVSLVSPGLSEHRQRIDFKKSFRDRLTQQLAELDQAICHDTLTDFSRPEPRENVHRPIALADLSSDTPTLESDLLEIPPLVRQNSYTLLDGPSPLIIAHVERNKPATVTSTPNAGARNGAANASPRRTARKTAINHSPRFGGVGSSPTNRGSPRRSSSQDSANRGPTEVRLRRRGWDLDNARAFWASSDALDRMFSVPRAKPVSVPPKPRAKRASGSNPSGNISLPTSTPSSPAKSLRRFDAFSSLDSLPSPAAVRTTRRSLFPKPTNQLPARAIETSHWSPPSRRGTPPRRDSKGSASLAKTMTPARKTAPSDCEITPVGSPISSCNAVGSVSSYGDTIDSPNRAGNAIGSVCSSRGEAIGSPKSARFTIGSPKDRSDVVGSVCSYCEDLTGSLKSSDVNGSLCYEATNSVCSFHEEIIGFSKSGSVMHSPADTDAQNESVLPIHDDVLSLPKSQSVIHSPVKIGKPSESVHAFHNEITSFSKSPSVVHSPVKTVVPNESECSSCNNGSQKCPHEEIRSPKSQYKVIDLSKPCDATGSLAAQFEPIVLESLAADAESPFARLQREHSRQMALLAERHRADAERLRREFAEQERQLLGEFCHRVGELESELSQDSETHTIRPARAASKPVITDASSLGNNTSQALRDVSARNNINARDSASLSGEKENVCDWYESSELNSLPRSGARRGDHAFRELHMNGQTAATAASRSSSRSSEGTVSSDGFAESCASWQLRRNSPAVDRRPPPTEREKRAAAVIVGAARGYLVRRLLRTAYVRDIRTTIRDVTLATIQLHKENHDAPRPEDVELSRRFIHQLDASWLTLHETFFELPTHKKLALIAADRARIGTRTTPASGRLSSATERLRRRKQAGSTSSTISRQSSRPASAVSTISAVSRNSLRSATPRTSTTPRVEQNKLKPWR